MQRARPSEKGRAPQATSTFPPLHTSSKLSPYTPHGPGTSSFYLHNQLIHPPPSYQGHGGTTYPSTPFGMKSSVVASWPRYGLLTTSQAVTLKPRSQCSLFEFGNRLNCEEICIQKFSFFSTGRGHFVLACLVGCL